MVYVLEMQISDQTPVLVLKGETESALDSEEAYVGKS